MRDHIFMKSNARKRAAMAAMAVLLVVMLAVPANASPANAAPANASPANASPVNASPINVSLANASAMASLASATRFSPLAGLAAGGVVQEMKDELADQAAADQNSTDQLTAGQSTAGLDNLPQTDAAQDGYPDATVYQDDTFSDNGTTYQDDTSSQDDLSYEEYCITHFTPIRMTDDYSYYITVPEEWWGFTEFGGWGESSLLEAYVYSYPEYRMTFWGLQEIPGSTLAAQLAGVPIIMESGSVTSFVQLLPQLSALAAQSGQLGMPSCTRVLSTEILKVTPVSAVTDIVSQTSMAGLITDEAIVEARMILDDGNYTEVTALIYATVAANGIAGFVSYSVMNVYGIFAPPDRFAEIARILAENDCGEFTLHDYFLQVTPGTEIDLLIYANSYQQWKNYILSNY